MKDQNGSGGLTGRVGYTVRCIIHIGVPPYLIPASRREGKS